MVHGAIDSNHGKPLLKIVPRDSSPEQFARFEHPRMPLIEAPIFSAEIPPDAPEDGPQKIHRANRISHLNLKTGCAVGVRRG